MNGKIIDKCIEMLKKDTPEIQYVLGMLEALKEMQPEEKRSVGTPPFMVLNSENQASGSKTTPSQTAGGLAERDPMLDIEASSIATLNKIKNEQG